MIFWGGSKMIHICDIKINKLRYYGSRTFQRFGSRICYIYSSRIIYQRIFSTWYDWSRQIFYPPWSSLHDWSRRFRCASTYETSALNKSSRIWSNERNTLPAGSICRGNTRIWIHNGNGIISWNIERHPVKRNLLIGRTFHLDIESISRFIHDSMSDEAIRTEGDFRNSLIWMNEGNMSMIRANRHDCCTCHISIFEGDPRSEGYFF